MSTRDVQLHDSLRDIVLRGKPNWTAVIFFATLGLLHYSIAVPAMFDSRWEGYMSLVLGSGFTAGALIGYCSRFELAILPLQRRLRLRSGLKRLHFQRFIDFRDIHGVRVTLYGGTDRAESRIELLCDNEDIECPPTQIPRQQALCLALLLGVRLIKVTPDGVRQEPELARV